MRPTLVFCALMLLVMESRAADIVAAALSHDAFQLTASAPTAARKITVDAVTKFTVEFASVSQTLKISLVAPAGAVYTIGSTTSPVFSSAIIPIDPKGASYVATFTRPVSGSWSISVSDTSTIKTPVDVLATTYFDNETRLVLLGSGEYINGAKVRVALVGFDRTTHIAPLTIAAKMFRAGDPSFAPVAVIFRDDGTAGDEKAGDGIYEAVVSPTSNGLYTIDADASGTASTGVFRRSASAALRIRKARAQITGFSDRGTDDDGDGLIDRLILKTSATIVDEGEYTIRVRLRASNGNDLEAAVRQTLHVGDGSVDVPFRADDVVKTLGGSGPYQVTMVRYYFKTTSDQALAGFRNNIGQTAPYSLGNFQHPFLRLVPQYTLVNFSRDFYGRYQSLNIYFFVDVDVQGTYTFGGSLFDKNGSEIDFATGSAPLQYGRNSVRLDFDGSKIGRHAVDGPYYVRNFSLYNGQYSMLIDKAFTTTTFKASEFVGFPVPRRRAVIHK